MTLVYLALAWGCGIWLAHLLWSQGLLGCATPGWPFGVLAGLSAVGWVLAGRLHLSPTRGGEYLFPGPSPARGGERRSPLPSQGREAGGVRSDLSPSPSPARGGEHLSPLPSQGRGAGGVRSDLSPLPSQGRGAGGVRLSALLLFLLLGAWRYHVHPLAACPTPADLAFYNGDEKRTVRATIEGVVAGYPDVRDVRTFYRLRTGKVTIGDETRAVAGDLLVQAPRFPEYAYGDRLLATGQLQTPPVLDDFDYRAYLARQGVHSLMRQARVERIGRGEGGRFWAILYGLRARGATLLGRLLPEPAASLLVGMTLGIESGIPAAVDEAFQATGTSHVIVISGSNVALLSGVLLAFFGRLLGKRRAPLPTAVVILLYVLLVGGDAAALRAGLMGVLYVIAVTLGRQSTAIVSLFASGLLMTAINPLTLWDVSFQLSFMATLGLISFTPALETRLTRLLGRWLTKERVGQAMGLLSDTLIVTLAAQIVTLPLIVYYFGRLSLVSLLTNFFILPAQPLIMMTGMATLVVGLLWEPLGRVLAVVPLLFLTYTTAVVRLTAAIPFASVATGALGRTLAVVYYGVLFGAWGVRKLEAGGWKLEAGSWQARLVRRGVGWAAMAIVPLWLGLTALGALPDGRLHLFFVPGEDGEAALIVTPTGRAVWIWDGRGDAATLARATTPLLTGWRKEVDVVLAPSVAADRPPAAQGLDPTQLAPNAEVRLDDAVTLTRLAAGKDWALLLRHGDFSALLPSTLKQEAQIALLAENSDDVLRVTLLKGAGPGAGAWPPTALLAATAAQVILWPQDTTYPPDVVESLTSRGALRVAPDAVLEIVSDGKQMWLRQRSGPGSPLAP